jgi:hypothetical protein
MNVDFTAELAKLLTISSRIAMSIRSRVPFDPSDPNGRHGSDPFWLSDAIHGFGELAECVAAREWSLTDAECQRALRQFQEYRTRPSDELGSPSVTFKRVGVDLAQIESVIRSIQGKALAAHRAGRVDALAPTQSRAQRKRA